MRATLTYHYGTPGQGGDTIKFRTNTSHRYIVVTPTTDTTVTTRYRTDTYSRATDVLARKYARTGRIFDTVDCTMRGTDTENNGERGASFRWWYVGPGMSKVSGQRGPSYRATAAVDRETDAAHLAARAPTAYDYTRRIGGSDYANPARSANLKSVAAQANRAAPITPADYGL